MGIYIKDMNEPKNCARCFIGDRRICTENCPIIEVPPHGKLIDVDALVEDLERQSKELFRIDAVSPDDYWIKRQQAYNEALFKIWDETFIEYLKSRPTIIEGEK